MGGLEGGKYCAEEKILIVVEGMEAITPDHTTCQLARTAHNFTRKYGEPRVYSEDSPTNASDNAINPSVSARAAS